MVSRGKYDGKKYGQVLENGAHFMERFFLQGLDEYGLKPEIVENIVGTYDSHPEIQKAVTPTGGRRSVILRIDNAYLSERKLIDYVLTDGKILDSPDEGYSLVEVSSTEEVRGAKKEIVRKANRIMADLGIAKRTAREKTLAKLERALVDAIDSCGRAGLPADHYNRPGMGGWGGPGSP